MSLFEDSIAIADFLQERSTGVTVFGLTYFTDNQTDISSNTSTKFHQNPNNSYQDISAMFSDKTHSDK